MTVLTASDARVLSDKYSPYDEKVTASTLSEINTTIAVSSTQGLYEISFPIRDHKCDVSTIVNDLTERGFRVSSERGDITILDIFWYHDS